MSQLIDVEDAQLNANDMLLAKRMAETLTTHYPGHIWAVNVDSRPTVGIATVMNMRLSGKWGFVLHLKDLYTDPDLKSVMRAGGELLERYRLKVGRFNPDQYDALPTDHAGNFVAEQ